MLEDKMAWISPLQLETWFGSVLAGSPEILTAIALLFIVSMAGYFRMNGIALFLMMGLFLVMFYTLLNSSLFILMLIIGGLIIAFTISRIFAR